MKKFITASVLSFMLLGGGSASADNDAHTWLFSKFQPTPMGDCIEAREKGLLMFKYDRTDYYVFDEKMYEVEIDLDSPYYKQIICNSSSLYEVLK